MPPPVTCANACTVHLAGELEHRGRVDHARAEQLVGERVVRARPRRAVEVASARGRAARRARASSRCSAGPGSRCRRCGRRRARRAGARATARRRRPRTRRGRTRPAPSRRGAPTSRRRAARSRAWRQPSATPRDDLVDLVGHELADRDVVEEEQRLGALRGDVVDRHRDAVDADRVAAVGDAGDQRLRADAVGRRDEQRIAVALPVEREQPAEAADVADDLGPERRADVRLDELDRLLARPRCRRPRPRR